MRAQAFFTGVGVSLLLSAPLWSADVSGAQPSNLSEIVETALKNNPEIHAAQRRVEAARARAGHATYLEDPEVNIEAWGVPLNQPLRYRSANPLVFGVRQKLPFFGKLGLKGDMAGEDVRIAEEELRAKEQEVVAKVKAAYADYFMAGKSVEIHRELLELIRHTSASAEGLYQVGRAPQQDIIKAMLERTELLNKLTWAEKDLSTAQARLNMLLSRPPDSFLIPPKEPAETPIKLQFPELEKLAIAQRPELRGLESVINQIGEGRRACGKKSEVSRLHGGVAVLGGAGSKSATHVHADGHSVHSFFSMDQREIRPSDRGSSGGKAGGQGEPRRNEKYGCFRGEGHGRESPGSDTNTFDL